MTLPQAAMTVQAISVPVRVFPLAEVIDPGTALDFPNGGEARDVPIPVPFLPGMDEVEVGEAAIALGTRAIERTTTHPGPTGTTATLSFSPPPGKAPLTLARIEIDGFAPGNEAVARSLSAPGLTLFWAPGGGASVPGPIADAQPLHLLASPANGPPFLAAPAYPMPGAGGALYGNALGGAQLRASRAADGRVDLVLTLAAGTPALASVTLRSVRNDPARPNLPNEATPTPWRASAIRAIWRLHPSALALTAVAAGRSVTVAQMPGDAQRSMVAVDIGAALRGLVRTAYPAAQGGSDLGLALRVTATGAGAAKLRLDRVGIRYLRRPLAQPARLSLRGAPLDLSLAGAAQGLRPSALDLAVEGRFLPDRLTDASDDAPAPSRRGLLADAATRLARRTTLTAPERTLPVSRLAVFGRAAAPAEILLTLHAGDALRIGPPLHPPAALSVPATEDPAWQRAVLRAPIAAPLPPLVWLVVQVPRGRFLWHGAAPDDDSALLSGDGGGSWTDAATRPALQIAVRDAVATPSPLPLRWTANRQAGTLATDIAGGSGPDFRQRLLLQPGGDGGALAAAAAASLTLQFGCRRDVDLSVSAVTFAYDPWTARS